MNPGKIKIVWVLSVASAALIILLQGYWLYNQYRYTLEKTAAETANGLVSASGDYKQMMKTRLRVDRKIGKPYSWNANQENSTFYVSSMTSNVTEWTISIRTMSRSTGKATADSTANAEGGDSTEDKIDNVKEYLDYLKDSNLLSKTSDALQKSDTTGSRIWKEDVEETDSSRVTTFRFKTAENQNLVYDAVDLFLANLYSPFKISDLDSIVRLKTGSPNVRIDTLTLPGDSVLWEPRTAMNLAVAHPFVSIDMPYDVLNRKVAVITVAMVPARIIRTMAMQIVVSLVLLLTIIVCLLLQIQTISKQQRINKLRQNFVNTTIHELKRPVQTLKTIVSYLQNSAPEEAEILNDARIETDNLTSYLQKLRDVNYAETISGNPDFSLFDFAALAKECIDKARKSSAKTIRVEMRFPGHPLAVTADRMALETAIVNLLENAVKYSGETPSIVFRAEKQGDNLIFAISDNGIGIPPSEQAHVFEPFYRSRNKYVSSLPGMGLGLSYVKMAVEAHGGSIGLQSAVNGGTTVTVKIPQQ